ncbi:MAG TPA: glycosyltransferase [Methylovirgula sp.]
MAGTRQSHIKAAARGDILLVNAFQKQGGAARAAYRIFEGIKRFYPNAHYLTLFRDDARSDISGVRRRSLLGWLADRLSAIESRPVRKYRSQREPRFTPAFWANPLRIPLARLKPRLVHLHWLGAGVASLDELARIDVPVIWTLHDAWPFTGGCHYTGTCDGYQRHCGTCPQLDSDEIGDLSHIVWQRKQRIYKKIAPVIVAPSHWLAEIAGQSSLLAGRRIEVIANGLDLTLFKPADRDRARAHFGLPAEETILLFGAHQLTDPRKGGDLLRAALDRIDFPCHLVTFGSGALSLASTKYVTVQAVAPVDDDAELALLYSAADVFVCPSREDNLPNMVAEALACATPCVAFEINGIPEMICHERNGFLAQPFAVDELVAGIRWVAQHPAPQALRDAARRKAVESFDRDKMAERYAALYSELLPVPAAPRAAMDCVYSVAIDAAYPR